MPDFLKQLANNSYAQQMQQPVGPYMRASTTDDTINASPFGRFWQGASHVINNMLAPTDVYGNPNVDLGAISVGKKLLDAGELATEYYLNRAKPIARGVSHGMPNISQEDLVNEAIAPIMEVASDPIARNYSTIEEAYTYLDNVARNAMRTFMGKFGYRAPESLTDAEGAIKEIVDTSSQLPLTPVSAVTEAAEEAERLTQEQSLSALEQIMQFLRPRDRTYVQARSEGKGIRRTAADLRAKHITVQKSIPETLVKLRESIATGQPIPLETRWGQRETEALLLGAKGWRKELFNKYSSRELMEIADNLPKEQRALTKQYLKGRSPQYLKDNFGAYTPEKLFGNLKELASMLEKRP